MKKFWKKVPAALLALVLLVSLLPVTALAASDITVQLPVSVRETAEAEEDIPADQIYRFLLKAVDGAPMPDEGGILDVSGSTSAFFSPIRYTHAGIYKYTIEMVPGDHPRGTYEKTVYNVTVSIVNKGDGLDSIVSIRKPGGGENEKFDSAAYTVSYSPLMKDVTVRKIWNDKGHTHPRSVRVSLVVNDQVVDTVTLNARNSWSYTWEELVQKRDNSWKVQEATIAGRYVPSYGYNYDKNLATVTNTYTEDLIQTGQLNWPIPVLCSLGTALIGFGLYMIFKKRDDACA